jgi:transcriptional regulator with XRE-family HTH domain
MASVKVDQPMAAAVTVGEMIAAYRRRHCPPNRQTHWSQEELAFATNTAQGHISRIESNRQIPEYPTLLRVCDALELSATERHYLFALAGYRIVAPLPDAQATDHVLSRLAPLLESYPYPVMLLDDGERNWYFNEYAMLLWGDCYGTPSQQAWRARVRGRRAVEFIFDPAPNAARLPYWQAYYEDVELVLTRVILQFWRAYRSRLNDPEMTEIVNRLSANPEFAKRWERVEQNIEDVLFLDHHTYVCIKPNIGRLQLQAWRTHATIDERFVVVHFTPADAGTALALTRLGSVGVSQARGTAQITPAVEITASIATRRTAPTGSRTPRQGISALK